MAQVKNSIIESIGVYLPPKEVTSQTIISDCKTPLRYPLERLTGIKSRRMAGETEFAIDLARQAIEKCLALSGYASSDIDLLICCNISRYDGPNFQFSFEPSTAVRLRRHFDMSNALCFDISNACAGMFTGVNVADAFLKAGIARNAMVVSGEYITNLTKTAQLEMVNERDQRLACLTLGDSGVAIILDQADEPGEGFHEIDMYTLSKHSDCCIARPTKSTAGGGIMLTDSARIHDVAISGSIKQIAAVVQRNGWWEKSIKHFIPHQTARPAMAELIQDFNEIYGKTYFDTQNMVYNLEHRGNTSSTTHFLAVWDNILNGRIQSGDDVLFAVQASGVTLGAAPYTFDDLPERIRNSDKSHEKPRSKQRREGARNAEQKQQKRVRIESFGTVSEDRMATHSKSAITLAATAAESCFERSRYAKSDIGILVYSGVHRDDFICEPAIATLIGGELEVNSHPLSDQDNKTFAFDVMNGGVGFLNACHSAYAMISSGRFSNAMVVASEIENNEADYGHALLGLVETGSAAILDATPDGDETGFLSFSFHHFTDHLDKYYSCGRQESGVTFLSFRKSPRLNDYFVDCISEAVSRYLKEEELSKEQIQAVFPPQISPEFVERLQKRLGFDPGKVVGLAGSRDYFTSSTLYGMQAALDRGMVTKGDVALIINVGTGIQVGLALYRF